RNRRSLRHRREQRIAGDLPDAIAKLVDAARVIVAQTPQQQRIVLPVGVNRHERPCAKNYLAGLCLSRCAFSHASTDWPSLMFPMPSLRTSAQNFFTSSSLGLCVAIS